MPGHVYRYEAANFFTDETFDVLPFPSSQFDVRISQAGAFSLPSPLGVASAQLGRRLNQLAPGATVIYVYRDTDLWWGGPVWINVPAGDQGGKATRAIQASTFDSYLNRVNFQADFTTALGDPLDQVRALLSNLQLDPNANMSLIADATTSGLSSPSKTYLASSNSSYGKAVNDLAVQSPGFDYAAAVTVDGATGTRTRRLRLGYPQFGGPVVHKLTRYGTGGGNILTYTITQDATAGGTECRAFGATSNTNQAGVSQPTISGVHTATALLAAGWPRLDFGNSYSTVGDLPTLNAHAAADLAAGQSPVIVPQVTVELDQTDITPASLGDTCVLSITDPNFPDGYTQTGRIVGIQVTTADRGNPETGTIILN